MELAVQPTGESLVGKTVSRWVLGQSSFLVYRRVYNRVYTGARSRVHGRVYYGVARLSTALPMLILITVED